MQSASVLGVVVERSFTQPYVEIARDSTSSGAMLLASKWPSPQTTAHLGTVFATPKSCLLPFFRFNLSRQLVPTRFTCALSILQSRPTEMGWCTIYHQLLPLAHCRDVSRNCIHMLREHVGD